jgi:hypothetical protein
MNALIAALVLVLPQVETPNGVPAHPGPAGETGRWALTPRVRFDRGRELRARGERVTDEAITTEHVRWIIRNLQAAHVDANAFNIALVWNCGLERVLQEKAPVSSYRFAGLVEYLALRQLALEQSRALPLPAAQPVFTFHPQGT